MSRRKISIICVLGLIISLLCPAKNINAASWALKFGGIVGTAAGLGSWLVYRDMKDKEANIRQKAEAALRELKQKAHEIRRAAGDKNPHLIRSLSNQLSEESKKDIAKIYGQWILDGIPCPPYNTDFIETIQELRNIGIKGRAKAYNRG